MPVGIAGGVASSGRLGSDSSVAGTPISVAIACSYWARSTPAFVACTRAASSVCSAWTTVDSFSMPFAKRSRIWSRISCSEFSGSSAVTALDVDGHGFGNLTDLVVGSDGKIQGVFDNGDRRDLAQVALADFANVNGLSRVGDGLVTETDASGNPQDRQCLEVRA